MAGDLRTELSMLVELRSSQSDSLLSPRALITPGWLGTHPTYHFTSKLALALGLSGSP